MSLYDTFATNKDLETGGVWLDFGGPRIKVARAGPSNVRYIALMTERTRSLQAQIRTDTLDNDKANEVLLSVYVDCIILDWENVTDQSGRVLEFNKSNVKKVLTDLPDLFAMIQEHAQRLANFRAQKAEDEAKN